MLQPWNTRLGYDPRWLTLIIDIGIQHHKMTTCNNAIGQKYITLFSEYDRCALPNSCYIQSQATPKSSTTKQTSTRSLQPP